ncbi:hypothetical protein MHUMG1_03973 [Metarhizium humberi]|uniref:Tetratricopeptide-like helical n=1 Tax=Metarhizium humberi TaxID=2596975 RepID=A0A9P8S9U4_9HYPO|nr:hypothetical protein MHUMG1_03973 [Metarhizium humberi]
MTEHAILGRIRTPLWHKALEKYKEELQAAADYQDIQTVHTLEQLMASFSSIQDSAPTNYAAVRSFNSIAPRLKFIDDFAAVLALCFDSTFLLVFDNVDDFAALKTAWPTAIHGSILFTTRDFIVATSLATKYVLVDALSDEDGSRLLLKAVDHDDSFRLRLKANSNRIGNSYSNTSSLLLHIGRPEEAEQSLAKCPALKDFSDETFLSTGNPRFSGDTVLLSRIRLAQGRLPDALRLASKALEFRRKLWQTAQNVRFSVRCSVYAIERRQLLQAVVGISETFVEGDGQRARAWYTLSKVYAVRDMLAESTACREKAVALRSLLRPDLKDAPFEEEEFSKLCLWMLW